MTSTTNRTPALFCAFVALSFLFAGTAAQAASHLPVDIFQEDFNDFTGFPGSVNDQGGHRTNFGVPTIAEGADNDWIGARFEFFDSNPLSDDVGVLRSGTSGSGTSGAPYDNPAGRVSDDAGLVLKLDLSGYIDATLSFDWRTFNTETTDRFVVAYYVGDGLGDPTASGAEFDWFNDPTLGNGDMSGTNTDGGQANPWYLANWTEVLRDTSPSSFQQESGISLPVGDILYLAFWLDNGDNDLGKFDNVWITATIPEPSSMAMLVLGLASSLVGMRRRHA